MKQTSILIEKFCFCRKISNKNAMSPVIKTKRKKRKIYDTKNYKAEVVTIAGEIEEL